MSQSFTDDLIHFFFVLKNAFQLLYVALGATNFMVISSPLADVLKTENYLASHSRYHARKDYGYGENELIVLFVGSYFHYDDIIWDFAAAMQALALQVSELEKSMNGGVHSIFLCGNSSDAYSSSFQVIQLLSMINSDGDGFVSFSG